MSNTAPFTKGQSVKTPRGTGTVVTCRMPEPVSEVWLVDVRENGVLRTYDAAQCKKVK